MAALCTLGFPPTTRLLRPPPAPAAAAAAAAARAAPQLRLRHYAAAARRSAAAAAAGGAAQAAAALEAETEQLEALGKEELMLSYSMDSPSDDEDEPQLSVKPRRAAASAAVAWRRRCPPPDQYRAVPVTVAGQQFDSLMDLRYRMRSLQRELVRAGALRALGWRRPRTCRLRMRACARPGCACAGWLPQHRGTGCMRRRRPLHGPRLMCPSWGTAPLPAFPSLPCS